MSVAKNVNANEELSLEELGLEGDNTPSDAVQESVNKADAAMKNAAASAALKAAIDANSEIAMKEAEKTYIIEKKKVMLEKCKKDESVDFVGQKIFAQYFGPVYTFLYNTIPVTVKFDGSTQKFPRFIAEELNRRIKEVSEANTNKVDIEYRNA